MSVIELKAKMYDLMAAKQQIEIQMQQVNQQIIEESKQKEEVMPKDVPQG